MAALASFTYRCFDNCESDCDSEGLHIKWIVMLSTGRLAKFNYRKDAEAWATRNGEELTDA